MKSILIVAPHPDDETLGCGGTLAKRVAQGCRVTVVVVTDGSQLFRLSEWKIEVDPSPSEASAMRKAETRRAVAILSGGDDDVAIRFLDFVDGTLADHVEKAAEKLAGIIEEVGADEIYVTSEHEWHSDHVAACQAVKGAMEKAGSEAKLYRYTVMLKQGLSLETMDQPTVAVDISDCLEAKRQAANQFRSHLDIVAKEQTRPFFESIDPWLGTNEAFFVDGD